MIALTLAASQPEFTQFLLERFGIVSAYERHERGRRAAPLSARSPPVTLAFSYLPTYLLNTGRPGKSYLPTICYYRNRAT